LVRDFDANRSYQDLINKIDYFKNLKINAIELMPVMEFEGNESWGTILLFIWLWINSTELQIN
jgi:1,4-alpha-glucan branching enzyme